MPTIARSSRCAAARFFSGVAGSLHVPVDQPLSTELLAALIEAKMRVLETDGQWVRPA
jgi:hypothetical protein